jgi:hypothetical protein
MCTAGSGLVHEDHEARARGRQTADPFHDGDAEIGLVDATIGFADRRHHRLPQRAAGADARTREQRHVEVVAHVFGHHREQERLARARRPDDEGHALGPADAPLDALHRRVDLRRRVIELRARGGHEGACGRVPAGDVHRARRSDGVGLDRDDRDRSDFDQRPPLPAPAAPPIDSRGPEKWTPRGGGAGCDAGTRRRARDGPACFT